MPAICCLVLNYPKDLPSHHPFADRKTIELGDPFPQAGTMADEGLVVSHIAKVPASISREEIKPEAPETYELPDDSPGAAPDAMKTVREFVTRTTEEHTQEIYEVMGGAQEGSVFEGTGVTMVVTIPTHLVAAEFTLLKNEEREAYIKMRIMGEDPDDTDEDEDETLNTSEVQ